MTADFKGTLRGFLLAPLPVFLLICVLAIRPSLGAGDMLFGLTLALAGSYGVMALVGLPADFLLRRMGMTSMAAYQSVAVVLVWVVLFTAALLEPASPTAGIGDHSPFAGASSLELLFSVFGFPIAGASAVAAAMTAGLFWVFAIRDRRSIDLAI